MNLQRAEQYIRVCLVLMEYFIIDKELHPGDKRKAQEATPTMILNLFKKCKMLQVLIGAGVKASAKVALQLVVHHSFNQMLKDSQGSHFCV